MARARTVEVELGDDAGDDGATPPAAPQGATVTHPRRWWWLAVPVAVVVALVLGQVVTDARERSGMADVARLPLVLDPVDGPVEVAWQVVGATGLGGGVRAGDVLVQARTTDDLAVALEGIDVTTGAGLWASEVVAARPDLGEETSPGPVACVTLPGDGREVACLATDGALAFVDGEPVTVAATTTRVLVLDAADGTVRADREAPTWAQWMTLVGDDVLLTGELDGTLMAERQDPRDGATRWSTSSPRVSVDLPSWAVPVGTLLDDETVAVDHGGEVVFLSAATGETLGMVASGDGQPFSAVVTMSTALGAALVVTDSGTQVATPGRAVSVEGLAPEVLVDDGSVPGLLLTRTPRLTAWDADDGTERWEVRIVDVEDVTVLDGRVHVGTTTDLVTLDAATGEELWRFDRPSTDGWTVTDGRHLYTAARRDGRNSEPYDVVALHPVDGSEAWRAPLPERSWLRSVAGLLVAVSYGPNTDRYEEVHRVLRGRG